MKETHKIQRHFGIFVYYVCRRQSISRESSVTLGYLCIMYTPNLASLWDICVLCMKETINLTGTQRHFGIFVYYVCRIQSISRIPSVTLGYTYVCRRHSISRVHCVTLGYLCITYVGDNQSHGYLASLWDICVLRMQETHNLPGTQRHFEIFVYYVCRRLQSPGYLASLWDMRVLVYFGIFVYYVCRRQSISRVPSVTLGYLCIMYVGDPSISRVPSVTLGYLCITYVGDPQSPGYLASLWDMRVLCMQETHNLPGTQRHFGIFVYYVCRRPTISRVPSVTLGYLCITYVGDPQSHGYLASLWDICVLCMQETLNLPGTQRHFGIFVYYVCRRPINLPGTQRHFEIFVYYVCRRPTISRVPSVTLGYLCIMYVGDNQSPGNLASLWDICVLRMQETHQSHGYLASLWDICVLCMQETHNLTGTQRHFGIFVYYVCRRPTISRVPSVTLGYLCIMYVGDPQSPGYLASLWDICVLCMQETHNLPGTQRHFGIFVYYVCRRPTISRVPSVTLGYLCIMYVGDTQSPGYLASLWDICVLCIQETHNLPGTQRHFEIFVYYVCRRPTISRVPSVTLGYLCIMYVGDPQSPGNLASLWDICVLRMQETHNLPGTQRHFGIFVYYVCRRQSISRVPSDTLRYLCITYAEDNQSPGYLASLWDICVLRMQETINLTGTQRHFGIFVYYVCRRHSISRVPSVTLGYLCITYVRDNQSPGYLASL